MDHEPSVADRTPQRSRLSGDIAYDNVGIERPGVRAIPTAVPSSVKGTEVSGPR